MNPDELKPFATVLKDGFMEVDCAKDKLFHEGDKFGDGKFSYALGDISNVSIVHYTELIAKEDREEMSHEVCFKFCRTLPEMHFFGIVNGRDCYCTPYFKPVAGDSSECDAVCPAKPMEFCGGKFKSSIFEMHDCKDSLENLGTATKKATEAADTLDDASKAVMALSKLMQNTGVFWQDVSGAIGQPAPSDLMQTAKVFAGELEHAAEAADKLKSQMDKVNADGSTMLAAQKAEPTGFDETTKMESVTRKANELATKADEVSEDLEDLAQLASPKFADTKDAAKQYYPLTYFVDKKIEELHSTCGGDTVQKPIVNVTADGCAAACDAAVHDCVGYSYFNMGMAPMCFLFSKFETVKYVIDCPKFLQVTPKGPAVDKPADSENKPVIGCFAKLSEFPSSIAPNPSGKCAGCLKEATKSCKK